MSGLGLLLGLSWAAPAQQLVMQIDIGSATFEKGLVVVTRLSRPRRSAPRPRPPPASPPC